MKLVVSEIKQLIKRLEAQAREFEAHGDFGRAEQCRNVALTFKLSLVEVKKEMEKKVSLPATL